MKKTVAVGEVADRAISRIDPGGKRHGARAVNAWSEVAGPEVAAHTHGFAFREKRELVVFVDSAAWANELSLMAPQLIERLNAYTGKESVRSLRFTVSKRVAEHRVEEAAEEEKDAFYAADEAAPVALDEIETSQAEHVAAAIDDAALREVALRVMIKDLERKKGLRMSRASGPRDAGPDEVR